MRIRWLRRRNGKVPASWRNGDWDSSLFSLFHHCCHTDHAQSWKRDVCQYISLSTKWVVGNCFPHRTSESKKRSGFHCRYVHFCRIFFNHTGSVIEFSSFLFLLFCRYSLGEIPWRPTIITLADLCCVYCLHIWGDFRYSLLVSSLYGAVRHQLPELTQTHVHRVSDAIQPSHPLRPLLLLPSVFPSIRVFSSESALCIRCPKYWVSASASVLPMNIQD